MLRFAMVIVMFFGASSDAFAKLKSGKQPKSVSVAKTGQAKTVKGP